MARDHARVLIRIWADEDWKALTSTEQWLYELLLSQEGINRAGLIDLHPRRWAQLASDMTIETIQKALRGLENARFVAVDADTEEVLVRSFIRNDGVVRQPNVLKNALNSARQVQSRRLREILAEELRRMIDFIPLDRRDRETNREGVLQVADLLFHPNAKGSPNPSRNPSSNPSDGDQVHHAENSTSQAPSEPFPEPFPEPFAEPPGEGEGVGEVVKSLKPVVATRTRDQPRATAEQLAKTATDPATYRLIATWRGTHQPPYRADVYTAISKHVAGLIATGGDHDAIRDALVEWDTRADAKPGLIPHLYDDALHNRRPGAAGKPAIVNGAPTMPVEQIPDTAIDPDEILGRDYWTPPVPPRDIDEGPAAELDAWVAARVTEHRADRVAEARRALIRRQNRSTA